MKFLRRLLITLTVLACPLVFGGVAAAAGEFNDVCNNSGGVNTSSSTLCTANSSPNTNPISGKDGILHRAAEILAFLTGVASVIMIIVGGLKYILANGDASSINSARNTILYALVGLLIALMAQAIISFVLNRL